MSCLGLVSLKAQFSLGQKDYVRAIRLSCRPTTRMRLCLVAVLLGLAALAVGGTFMPERPEGRFMIQMGVGGLMWLVIFCLGAAPWCWFESGGNTAM